MSTAPGVKPASQPGLAPARATTAGPGAPAPTRTPATEAAYLARALWLETRASRAIGVQDIDPREAAAYAIEQRHGWARSTWKQIKSALVYRYASMGTAQAAEAVAALKETTQTACVARSKNTSGSRKKGASDKDLARILAALARSRSRYRGVLESWLTLGVVAGLRPHEWGQAALIYARPSELGDDSGGVAAIPAGSTTPGLDDTVRPYLEVDNSKTTNRRSHGPRRHLDLGQLPLAAINAIEAFATSMRNLHSSGEYPKVYAGCQVLLARTNRSLGYVGARSRVQIYSPRHQFSANAKKALSLNEVAAIMGHAVNKTATQHYGKRSHGASGFAVRPSATETLRIRDTYRQRGGTGAPGHGNAPAAPGGAGARKTKK